MQTFYVITEKDVMSIYVKDNNSYKRLYIEGNPRYSYDINSAKECMDKLLLMLINEYNLNSIGEIDLIVIENEDKLISEVMGRALYDHIKEKIAVEELISKISQRLSKDKKLYISEYGINFDGKNYLFDGKIIEKSDFSLLGYTLMDDELIKYVE